MKPLPFLAIVLLSCVLVSPGSARAAPAGGLPAWIGRACKQVRQRHLRAVTAASSRLRDSARSSTGALGRGRELLRRLAPRRLLATGRLVLGTTALTRAVTNASLSDRQRAQLLRRATDHFRSLPLTLKFLQTTLNTLDLATALVPPQKRKTPEYRRLVETLAKLRPLVQSKVTPLSEATLRTYLGASAQGLPLGPDSLLAAGSIGQVHVGHIMQRLADGQERRRPVVVKVRKPGLERDIESTSAAIRDGFGVLQAILRRPALFPQLGGAARGQLTKLVTAAREIFPGYVQDFRREGDLGAELRAMRDFRRIYRDQRHILVPEPIAARSNDKVLMMARIEGDSLAGYLRRFARAQRWRRVRSRHRGPLPAGVAGEREAIRRARLFARQTYGLDPKVGPRVEKTAGGYRLTVAFDSTVQPAAQIEVTSKGRLRALGTVPELSVRGVIGLQRRMLGAFITSAHQGVVHGDPHQGNLRVLADGKTLALLDFGNVVRVPATTKTGLAMALRGLALGRSTTIARGLLQTVSSFASLDAPRQQHAIRATSGLVRELLRARRSRDLGRLNRQWPELLSQLQASGVRVEARDVGLLRASLTLLGNVVTMQRALGRQLPKRKLWAAQLGDTASASLAHLARRLLPQHRKVEDKDLRAQRLYDEAQQLRAARLAPQTTPQTAPQR